MNRHRRRGLRVLAAYLVGVLLGFICFSILASGVLQW